MEKNTIKARIKFLEIKIEDLNDDFKRINNSENTEFIKWDRGFTAGKLEGCLAEIRFLKEQLKGEEC